MGVLALDTLAVVVGNVPLVVVVVVVVGGWVVEMVAPHHAAFLGFVGPVLVCSSSGVS